MSAEEARDHLGIECSIPINSQDVTNDGILSVNICFIISRLSCQFVDILIKSCSDTHRVFQKDISFPLQLLTVLLDPASS